MTRWCALVVALAAKAARAEPPLVRVDVTASAQVPNAAGAFAPSHAVDVKTSTAWCAPDGSASLTLTFDHPVLVQRIAVRTGGGPADKRSSIGEIVITTSDGRTMDVARSEHFVQVIGGRPVGSLSIAFADVHGEPGANILFCRFPDGLIRTLQGQGYTFYSDRWEPGVVRVVTSFAHRAEDIDDLLDAVRAFTGTH